MKLMQDNAQDKYLSQMLEGYEKALPEMGEFISNAEAQLKGATERREEIIASIAELKELLGIADEADE